MTMNINATIIKKDLHISTYDEDIIVYNTGYYEVMLKICIYIHSIVVDVLLLTISTPKQSVNKTSVNKKLSFRNGHDYVITPLSLIHSEINLDLNVMGLLNMGIC